MALPPLWFGLMMIAVGAVYPLWAPQIRDWQVRRLQRRFYLIMMRLSGVLMCLVGLAIVLWGLLSHSAPEP